MLSVMPSSLNAVSSKRFKLLFNDQEFNHKLSSGGVLYKSCPTPATLLKKRPWRRCFPASFAKHFKTNFYITTPVTASDLSNNF